MKCRVVQKSEYVSKENPVNEDDEVGFNHRENVVRSLNHSMNVDKKPVYISSSCGGLTIDLINELINDLNFDVDLFEVTD